MNEINLTEKELIELKYEYMRGYKYIARNEIGSVSIYKKKPIRHRRPGSSCYAHWIIEDNFPIKKHDEYGYTHYGKYDFITWEDEPMLIENIIN